MVGRFDCTTLAAYSLQLDGGGMVVVVVVLADPDKNTEFNSNKRLQPKEEPRYFCEYI